MKAHAGIKGNEAADTLASQVHAESYAAQSVFHDSSTRGPAWLLFWLGETLSELDALREHALRVATTAFITAVMVPI